MGEPLPNPSIHPGPHRAASIPQDRGAGCGSLGDLGTAQNSREVAGRDLQPCPTWIRLAAGVRLFSKCFCRCCSCTLRAKPEPRMPWGQEGTGVGTGGRWVRSHRTQRCLCLFPPHFSLSRPYSRQAGRRRRCRAGRTRPPASGPATSAAPCPRSRWWSGSPTRGHSSGEPGGRSPHHGPVPPSCTPPGAGEPRGEPSLPCPTRANRRRWRTAHWRPSRPGTRGRRRR